LNYGSFFVTANIALQHNARFNRSPISYKKNSGNVSDINAFSATGRIIIPLTPNGSRGYEKQARLMTAYQLGFMTEGISIFTFVPNPT
jgi:hypothetical protein